MAGAPGNAGHLCGVVWNPGAPEPLPPVISHRCAPLRRQQAGRLDSGCANKNGRKSEYTTAAKSDKAARRRIVSAYTTLLEQSENFLIRGLNAHRPPALNLVRWPPALSVVLVWSFSSHLGMGLPVPKSVKQSNKPSRNIQNFRQRRWNCRQ
jgi:hypothetical protein